MVWLRGPLGSGIVMMSVMKTEVVERPLVENGDKSKKNYN